MHGQINRSTTWAQDGVVSIIEPKFSWLVPTFFGGAPVQFDTEFIEFDVVEGGVRIAPYSSPLSLGKATRELGFRTYQLKPAYIKLLDTVRPGQGFQRLPGEAYGGSLSTQERLNRKIAEKIVTHREMIETRWEQMASDALFHGKIVITDEDYPRSVVDFERDPNLMATVGTVWSNPASAPLDDIVEMSDKVNVAAKGAVVNTLVMRTATWDALRKHATVKDLVDTNKNLSPGTSAIEFGPRSSDKKPVWRGRLAGQYDVWTYDGYYENDLGGQVPFVPAGKVLLVASGQIEGKRYHGAIYDMDAGMQAIEVFVKTRDLWNPSGTEVLTQSAPMLGMKRPNASAVLTVL